MKNLDPFRQKPFIHFCKYFVVVFAVFFFNSIASFAQGDLMIFPKRLVFDGGKRSQEINLANSGKESARYVLSVIQIRMKEDGGFEQISQPDSGQLFADKYFRIFPRAVVLGPNESQTVKVQLINTAEMQPGEYRSHIYIRAEEEKKPLGEKEKSSDGKAINIKLVAVFGISIPVIIRTGDNTTSVSLSDVTFRQPVDSVPVVKFNFNRKGNMSAYGDIKVEYLSPDGKTIPVGSARGIAVYNPTAKRSFTLELTPAAGVDFRKGSLRVSYKTDFGKNDKPVEQTISLKYASN